MMAELSEGAAVWDEAVDLERRVEGVLQNMTLQDKIDLVSGKLVVDDAGRSPRLPEGLPELLLADGPAGLRISNPAINGGRATALPAPLALAATWDPALARQYGDLIGAEAAATGHNVFLGPAVDIARAPLAGRTFESFGEDPLLQARMVVPEIQAIQSHAVLACIKHYVANNQEFQRSTVDVQVDERTLQEVYLLPFAAAVREGRAGSAMGSYNRINGVYACENHYTLTEVLRKQWGFQGFVMSDYLATPSTAGALRAGLDWELGPRMWGDRLAAALERGELSLAELDDVVRRILRPVLGLGLADRPRSLGSIAVERHSAVARTIAEQGMVLLKNAGGLLPLAADRLQSIAVIGVDAGNVAAAGGGSGRVQPAHSVSVLDGLRARAGANVRVAHAPGVDPIGPGVLLPGLPAVSAGYFGQEGVQVAYWDNPTFSGPPAVTRQEPRIEFNYGFFDLLPGLRAASPGVPERPDGLRGRLSVRYSGRLIAPASGDYRLSLTCLGTARLVVDGELLIDSAAAEPQRGLGNGPAQVFEAVVELVEGRSYPLTVDYAADAPGHFQFDEAMLRLGWLPPEGVVSPAVAEAAALAADSDIAVVVVRTYETEEMDRPGLALPNGQDELIRRVAAANPRTIVVLMNAGPLETASWEAAVPAILEAWYAGQEQGGAVARVLFGDVNPSGRLPLSFPRSLDRTPTAAPAQYPGVEGRVYYSEGPFVGYRGYEARGIVPQYAFGYGLSYTTFEYADLQLEPAASDGVQPVVVSFVVTNTGSRAGVDVPQVYVGLSAGGEVPLRRLVGWARVVLEPGERRRVEVVIDPASAERPLSVWNAGTQAWELVEGEHTVYLAASATDVRARAGLRRGLDRRRLER